MPTSKKVRMAKVFQRFIILSYEEWLFSRYKMKLNEINDHSLADLLLRATYAMYVSKKEREFTNLSNKLFSM